MPELGSHGSVRGARGNSRPYRESRRYAAKPTRRTQPEVDAPKHPTFAADLPVFGRFETVRDSSAQASDVMLSSAALVSKICGDQIKELLLPGQDHLIFFELRLLMQDRT